MSWAYVKDGEKLVPNARVGTIRGEPRLGLRVNTEGLWSVWLDDRSIVERFVEDYQQDRICRKRGMEVSKLDIAKDRAIAYVAVVISTRDLEGDEAQA